MLGWMTIFSLMFVGAGSALARNLAEAPVSLEFATVISGVLLLACILTRVASGRA
jgi:hypothetical protein